MDSNSQSTSETLLLDRDSNEEDYLPKFGLPQKLTITAKCCSHTHLVIANSLKFSLPSGVTNGQALCVLIARFYAAEIY